MHPAFLTLVFVAVHSIHIRQWLYASRHVTIASLTKHIPLLPQICICCFYFPDWRMYVLLVNFIWIERDTFGSERKLGQQSPESVSYLMKHVIISFANLYQWWKQPQVSFLRNPFFSALIAVVHWDKFTKTIPIASWQFVFV